MGFRLRLNADKTQFIWLGTSHFLGQRDMPTVNSILQSTVAVNDLGVHLDPGLVMDRQVSKLCQVCYFHLRRLRTVRRSLTKESLPHSSPCLRNESGRPLQRYSVRRSFLPPRQDPVRAELGRPAGPEHSKVQPHISCDSRRAPLASNLEKDRIQDRPHGPTLRGWYCAGIPERALQSGQLGRRSTMSPVSFPR